MGLYEQLEADTVLYMQAERMPPDVQHQGLKYLEHEWRSQLRSQGMLGLVAADAKLTNQKGGSGGMEALPHALQATVAQSVARFLRANSELIGEVQALLVPPPLWTDRCTAGGASPQRAPASQPNAPLVMARSRYKQGTKIENHINMLGTATDAMVESLPDTDPLEWRRFGSCAVVASAGILLQRKLGGWIDMHNATFRFNSAYTVEMEQSVPKIPAATAIRMLFKEPGSGLAECGVTAC